MTKDTERAFVIIYAEYLRRRSFGTAKYEAMCFEGAKIYAIDAFKNWHPGDIDYCLQELRKSGYVKIDIIGDVALQEAGIEYMEKKPRDYFAGFTGIIKDLLSLVATFLSI